MEDEISSEDDRHPVLLPWYAAGTLDAWSVRQIDEHLKGCAACRVELEALVSTAATLRRHEGTNHIEIAELLDFEDGRAAGGERRRETVRAHLAGCEACREDLEALRAARRALGVQRETRPVDRPQAVRASNGHWMWRWAFLAATAAVVVLLIPALRDTRPGSDAPLPREIHPVRLMAQVRGNEGLAELAGSGPWILEVVLPFGAPSGRYQLTITPGASPASKVAALQVQATKDGILSFLLPSLPGAGAYRMTADSIDQPGASYAYGFNRVDSGPAAGTQEGR